MGQEPQSVVLMPILEGLDGVQKMSKSLGNYVGITESPQEMFNKLMSLPDHMIRRYFELCTDVDLEEVDRKLATQNPRDTKRWLAREIITIYHSAAQAEQADSEWLRVVSQGEVPAEIPTVKISTPQLNIVELVVQAGLAPSKREARRSVTQGAVVLEGQTLQDPTLTVELKGGETLKLGKKWRRLEV